MVRVFVKQKCVGLLKLQGGDNLEQSRLKITDELRRSIEVGGGEERRAGDEVEGDQGGQAQQHTDFSGCDRPRVGG